MLNEHLTAFGIIWLLALSGCAPNGVDVACPKPRPLGRDIPAYQAPRTPPKEHPVLLKAKEPTEAVILRQALSLALMGNPELAAFSWEVRAKEARSLQASLLPNPEVEFEAEEFGGTGERSGFDAAESSLRLSQLIELAGKRAKRTKVATLERDLAGWDYESKRLEVLTQTTKAFVEVLAGQEQLVLAKESVVLAERILETVSERVRAGKVSPLEEMKAKVTLSTSRIDLERAERDLESARQRLSAMWGSTSPGFNRAGGDLYTMSDIPSVEKLLKHLSQNPDIGRWKNEMESRRASVELESARRVPDLTLHVGVQRFEETGDNAAILGLSVPLPLFDRNQGRILEARYKLAKAIEDRRATEMRVKTVLSQTHQLLSASHFEAVTLKNDVLPAAQGAFDAAKEGYEQGKFGYLDVLDAQRTLFEASSRYVGALAKYHRAVAVLESLIGTGLDSLGGTPERDDQSQMNKESTQ